MRNSILIVEDDTELASHLKTLLRQAGYSATVKAKATEALKFADTVRPDLVLLDLQLPDLTGEGVSVELKKTYPDLPVIMLTGKDTISDKLEGFRSGADDYITKPFNADELMARINAKLRQTNANGGILRVDDLELNQRTVEVKRGGKTIALTPQEFKLLEFLMKHAGTVLSREMILNRIWQNAYDIETRVVDVYVGYLRKKIDKGARKRLIHSVRGFGYTLKAK